MKTLLGLILNLSEHNGFKCVITINMSLAEATGIQGIRPRYGEASQNQGFGSERVINKTTFRTNYIASLKEA